MHSKQALSAYTRDSIVRARTRFRQSTIKLLPSLREALSKLSGYGHVTEEVLDTLRNIKKTLEEFHRKFLNIPESDDCFDDRLYELCSDGDDADDIFTSMSLMEKFTRGFDLLPSLAKDFGLPVDMVLIRVEGVLEMKTPRTLGLLLGSLDDLITWMSKDTSAIFEEISRKLMWEAGRVEKHQGDQMSQTIEEHFLKFHRFIKLKLVPFLRSKVEYQVVYEDDEEFPYELPSQEEC